MNSLFILENYSDSVSNLEENNYHLLFILGSLTPLKIKIILILAHISQMRLTATQLTALLGYSKNSRVIYRGVLDELVLENYIKLEKISSKKFSIQLNLNHPLMNTLNELSYQFGENYSITLENMLEGLK